MNEFDSQTILLVEDDENDLFIFDRAAKLARVAHPIQIVNDGKSAIDYLSGSGAYADRNRFPLPFLVLLDLKLPAVNGPDVLRWIREQSELNELSVIVLTSSAEDRDIVRAYQLGARSYLVKPPTAACLMELLGALRVSASSAQERLRISAAMKCGELI